MTADELKSMKKGSFIVMKTGAHPFVSRLKLFMKWGISFPSQAYTVEDRGARRVQYISRERLIHAITDQFPQERRTPSKPRSVRWPDHDRAGRGDTGAGAGSYRRADENAKASSDGIRR